MTTYEFSRGQMKVELEKFRLDGKIVPSYLHQAILEYTLYGAHPGKFLEGIITNDLSKVMTHGSAESLEYLRQIYGFFYNRTPSICWGSMETMNKWIKKGGQNGR